MKKLILITASVLAMSCSPNAAIESTAQTMTQSEYEMTGKLYVSATGEAAQAPDEASVSAGVVTEGKTAGEAMSANARLMSSAFSALKEAGIKDRDIQTSQMSLQPQYDYQNRQKPRITGYQARNTVSPRTDDLENVGPMLGALVSAGVNAINGVNFGISLSLWDYIFKTNYVPEDSGTIELGYEGDEKMSKGFLRQLFYGFRKKD